MDILARMNWVDILVVIIMFRISYVAFQDGLSHEIFPLIAAVCSIVLSLQYYNGLAVYLSQKVFNLPIGLAAFLSFAVLVIAIGYIFKFIRIFLDKIIKVTWHPIVEKFGGLIAGIARASITTSIVLIIIALIPLLYLTLSIKERSLTGMYFLRIGPAIYEKVSGVVPSIKAEISENIVKGIVKDKPALKNTKKTEKLIPEYEKALQ